MQNQTPAQPQSVPFEQRAFLTVAQAAQYSGLGRTRLYAALRAGRVTAKKHGRRTLIDRRSLVAFLDSSLSPYMAGPVYEEGQTPAMSADSEPAQSGRHARPVARSRDESTRVVE